MIIEVINKLLDNKLELSRFEEWVYNDNEIEKLIGEEDYVHLMSFKYSQRDASFKLRKFLLSNVTSESEFVNWKTSQLLDEIGVTPSIKDLFSYCLVNPNFMKGRKMKFNQLWTKNEVEISWINRVINYSDSTSEKRSESNYLCLGKYENGYITLLLNKKNEIWVDYNIVDKQEFFAKSLKDAIAKLILDID